MARTFGGLLPGRKTKRFRRASTLLCLLSLDCVLWAGGVTLCFEMKRLHESQQAVERTRRVLEQGRKQRSKQASKQGRKEGVIHWNPVHVQGKPFCGLMLLISAGPGKPHQIPPNPKPGPTGPFGSGRTGAPPVRPGPSREQSGASFTGALWSSCQHFGAKDRL